MPNATGEIVQCDEGPISCNDQVPSTAFPARDTGERDETRRKRRKQDTIDESATESQHIAVPIVEHALVTNKWNTRLRKAGSFCPTKNVTLPAMHYPHSECWDTNLILRDAQEESRLRLDDLCRPLPAGLRAETPLDVHRSTSLMLLQYENWPLYLQAYNLFALLCALESNEIPEFLFCRLRKPRIRWGCNGEVEYVSVSETSPLIHTITKETPFDISLRLLEYAGLVKFLVKTSEGPLTKRKISIKPSGNELTGGAVPDLDWIRLVLLSHAFPGTREEQGFSDTGRALLPLLQHAVENCDNLQKKMVENRSAGYDILLTLLLSTRLGKTDWKFRALDLADKLLSNMSQFSGDGAFYLRGLAEQRRSDMYT